MIRLIHKKSFFLFFVMENRVKEMRGWRIMHESFYVQVYTLVCNIFTEAF